MATTKQFNRTVEVINDLLDKLDALPTYPVVYKGIRTNPSYLPEEPTEGDLYYVQYSDTNNEHVANYLYLRKATAWEIIATKSYTQYEIDQMFESIGGGLHWKGAVSYYSNLPSDAELGDMWTVLYEGSSGTEACGDEYAWGTLSGTEQWILIGKETYSKTQIDNMVDGLTDRIALDENNISSLTANGGGKNLLDCSLATLKADSYNTGGTTQFSWSDNVCSTPRGVSFTINSDNSITVSATSVTADVWFRLAHSFAYGVGTYTLSGCPSGGSTSTYYIESDNLNIRDTGNGATITRSSSYTDSIFIVVKSGTTFTGTFKPMISLSSDKTYQPYALSNVDLTAKNAVNENNILSIQTDLASAVVKGAKYTANTAKTYTLTAGTTYLITVISYAVAGVFLALKYNNETSPRLFPVYKAASFDNSLTVASVADSSDISITPTSSSIWYISNIATL